MQVITDAGTLGPVQVDWMRTGGVLSTRSAAHMRNVTVPASILVHLGHAIHVESGSDAAAAALQRAGFESGNEFFREFEHEAGEELAALPESRFWESLAAFFDVRGWGRITQNRVHPALGMLHTTDWGESYGARDAVASRGCAFSAGVFAHIFGRVAGGAIGVLEVGCRSRGDAECTFILGPEGAVDRLRALIAEGIDLDAALVELQ